MKKLLNPSLWFLLSGIFVIIFVGKYFSAHYQHLEQNVQADSGEFTAQTSLQTLPVYFYDQELFSKSLSQINSSSELRQIAGGVVPHHLVASPLIADFFQRLRHQQVKRIILIGPNHYELGGYPVLTAQANWDTPFGLLPVDQESQASLLQLPFVGVQNEVLVNDHSVAGLMPFIKYFLPDVSVLPLVIKQQLSTEERAELIEQLSSLLDSSTVIVVSTDFSHYLSVPESKQKDEETWQAIQSEQSSKLIGKNSDYLDSPESLVILMEVMRTHQKKVELLKHSNAGEMTGNFSAPTTSYFELAFY